MSDFVYDVWSLFIAVGVALWSYGDAIPAMKNSCTTNAKSALDNDLAVGHPLRLDPWINASPRVDHGVAQALLDFFLALDTRRRSGALAIWPLVRDHLDSPVDEFFRRHTVSFLIRPHLMSVYAKHGARNAANTLRHLWRRTVDCSVDPLATEATLNALHDAFEFLDRVRPKTGRVPLEDDHLTKRPTRRSPLEPYERCKRCERWSERYERSIRVPGKLNGLFTLKMHSPRPRTIIRLGSDEFCSECNSRAGQIRQSKVESWLEGNKLSTLMQKNGADALGIDARRRVARLLSSQSGPKEAAAIASVLRSKAAHAQAALEEFFGVALPADLGVNAGKISCLDASMGCGLYASEAETGALLKLDATVESHHATGAIGRALAWTKIRRAKRQPESVEIDIPELGLILSAYAAAREGEPWSMSAVIDRAANYEWIPAHLKKVNSDRQLR